MVLVELMEVGGGVGWVLEQGFLWVEEVAFQVRRRAEGGCTHRLPQMGQSLRLGPKAVGLWGRPDDMGLEDLSTSM